MISNHNIRRNPQNCCTQSRWRCHSLKKYRIKYEVKPLIKNIVHWIKNNIWWIHFFAYDLSVIIVNVFLICTINCDWYYCQCLSHLHCYLWLLINILLHDNGKDIFTWIYYFTTCIIMHNSIPVLKSWRKVTCWVLAVKVYRRIGWTITWTNTAFRQLSRTRCKSEPLY